MFKVGDIVICKDEYGYTITDTHCLLQVLQRDANCFTGQILMHTRPCRYNQEKRIIAGLHCKDFKLASDSEIAKIVHDRFVLS